MNDFIDIDDSESRRLPQYNIDESAQDLLGLISGGIKDRMDCLANTTPPLPLLSADIYAPILALPRVCACVSVSDCRDIDLCLVDPISQGGVQVELKSRPFARCCK
jgi:hypothetical protein